METAAASTAPFHPDSLARPELMARRRAIVQAYGAQRYIAHCLACIARPDRTGLLDGRHPTLLVTTTHDRVVAPENLKRLAADAGQPAGDGRGRRPPAAAGAACRAGRGACRVDRGRSRAVTPLPLQGLRVFDLSQGVAGPYCTMLLAAQGADVVKVEPFEGDWIRSGRNQHRGHTPASITVNLGKRSVALDLKHPDGPGTARRIAAGCDIVIESFRPGVAARLGLDDATLRADRPDLIYASVSGFGQDGPLSRRGVVDQIMQAFCGWMTLNADAAGQPQRTRNVVLADQVTGLYAYQAVSGALIGKLRHGTGARLDISLMGAMAAFLAPRLVAAGTGGGEAGQVYFAAPTGEYPTRAGTLMLAARKPAEYQRFCEAIGRPDLHADERYATQEARNRNAAELDREIAASLSTRGADEWETLLNERGVMASVVRSVGQFMASEQMRVAGLVETVDVGGVGECPLVRLPGAPAWSARTQAPAVPAIGQHGGDILREAGLAERDIRQLAAARCVRLPSTEEVSSHVS